MSKAVIDALIVLNESAYTIEQISGLLGRMASGEVPTEAELDEKRQRNHDFVKDELAKLDKEE